MLFLIALIPNKGFAATPINKFTFTVDPNTNQVTITKFIDPDATVVEVPKTYEENPVVAIADGAFKDHKNLYQITIPNSIKTIGNETFSGCTALYSVRLNEGLQSIGTAAFKGCKTLPSITIPSTVKTIRSNTFDGCSKLEGIVLKEGFETIESSVFRGCTSLKLIEFPSTLKSIGSQSFANCVSIPSIKLPESITNIYGNAFEGCTNLTRIEMTNAVTTIGSSAFKGCENLSQIAITGVKNPPLVLLPENLVNLGASAFEGCKLLKEITIPEKVASISNKTFKDCLALKKVSIMGPATTFSGDAIFEGIKNDVTLHVLKGSPAYTYVLNNSIKCEFIPISLENCEITVDDMIYTGKPVSPTIKFKNNYTNFNALKFSIDYTLSYGDSVNNNTNIGTVPVTVTGINAFKDSLTSSFRIIPGQVAGEQVTSRTKTSIGLKWNSVLGAGGYEIYQYNPSNKEWARVTTTANTSYTVSNLLIGTNYKFKIRAYTKVGNQTYYGAYSNDIDTLTIIAELSECKIGTIKNQVFNNSEIKPTVNITYNNNKLVAGTDFKVEYESNKYPGLAKVTITGSDKYPGGKTINFKILPKTVTGQAVTIVGTSTVELRWTEVPYVTDYEIQKYNYSKKEWEVLETVHVSEKEQTNPMPTKKYNLTKSIAGEKQSFSIRGYRIVNGVRYNGGFSDVVTLRQVKDLKDINVSVDTSEKTYSGRKINPKVVIKDGNTVLKYGTDYTVTYTDNIDIGTGKGVIEGKGFYKGKITKTFAIVPRAINSTSITVDTSNKVYSGKDIRAKVVVKYRGETLRYAKDYYVEYKDNKKPGTATVTIYGHNNYKGSVKKTYKILIGTVSNYKITKPKSDTVKLTWKKPRAATGYDIYMSTNRNSGYSKIGTTKNTSFTKSGLSGDKIYYFKVRTYMQIGSKRYYSPYSNFTSMYMQ